MRNVLVIGGHGMLGRPVVRRLVQEGFTVRAMARSVEKAQKLLPASVEVVKGDLENVDSIRKAATSMDIIYMNLETPNPKAPFKPDLDGPKNVVKALKDRPEVMLVKIAHHPLVDTQGWWPNNDLKLEGEKVIRESGHPYLFFHPTWFMETLNLFKQGNKASLFGRKWNPLYFVAGDDYGRIVAAAFKNPAIQNRTFVVQGLEALDFEQAVKRFFAAELDKGYIDKKRSLQVLHIPMLIPWMLAPFVPLMKDMHRLHRMAQMNVEEFVSKDTWSELGKPQMKVEDYVNYMTETGDIPEKH